MISARDVKRVVALSIVGLILTLGILSYGVYRLSGHLLKKEVPVADMESMKEYVQRDGTAEYHAEAKSTDYFKGLIDAMVMIGAPLCFYFCKKCIDYWFDHQYKG